MVLGSYVISLKSFNIIVMYYSNINKMSCFYFFVFFFPFYFICLFAFILRISKLKIEFFLEKDHFGF